MPRLLQFSGEKKKEMEKVKDKKKLEFHGGREPEIFPRVKFDINDHEFVEMLRDMD